MMCKTPAKLYHQRTNTQVFTGQMPFFPTNSVRALKGIPIKNTVGYKIIKPAVADYGNQ